MVLKTVALLMCQTPFCHFLVPWHGRESRICRVACPILQNPFSPTAESSGVFAQVGSGVVRGGFEVWFEEGFGHACGSAASRRATSDQSAGWVISLACEPGCKVTRRQGSGVAMAVESLNLARNATGCVRRKRQIRIRAEVCVSLCSRWRAREMTQLCFKASPARQQPGFSRPVAHSGPDQRGAQTPHRALFELVFPGFTRILPPDFSLEDLWPMPLGHCRSRSLLMF